MTTDELADGICLRAGRIAAVAHHVELWSEGGTTDLSNLVLVCARHHTLIHTQGFQLVLHADRRLTVDGLGAAPPRPALG